MSVDTSFLSTLLYAYRLLLLIWLLDLLIRQARARINWHRKMAVPSTIVYAPIPGKDRWRWAVSPRKVGLQVNDDESCSQVLLQPPEMVGQTLGLALALFFALGSLWMLESALVPEPGFGQVGGRVFLAVIGFLMARAMLFLETRVIAIDLLADRVVFHERYARFFQRQIAVSRTRIRSWSNTPKVISLPYSDKLIPFYEFKAHLRWIGRKRFILKPCNREQGEWILAGLQYWLG
jgi:hypothetical protein